MARRERKASDQTFVLGGELYSGNDPRLHPPYPEWSEEDYINWRDGRMTKAEYLDRVRVRERFGRTGDQRIFRAADFGLSHGIHQVIERLAPLPGGDPIIDCIQALEPLPSITMPLLAEEIARYRYRPGIQHLQKIGWRAWYAKLVLEDSLGTRVDNEIEDRDLKKRPKLKPKRIKLYD
jgi:hypothetical protein